MTELSFAKTFLSLLDARPQKRPPDYSVPAQSLDISHQYTLPRMSTPMQKPSSSSSDSADPKTSSSSTTTAASPKVALTLKSSRPPVLSLTLPDIDVSITSMLDLKDRVARELRLPQGVEKVRVLYARKPVGADTRTVKEVLGGDEGLKELGGKAIKGEVAVEFGIMVMGWKGGDEGSPAPQVERAAGTGAGADTAGKDTADAMDVDEKEGEDFWEDLKGFLLQRVKDEGRATQMVETFREAWKGK